MTSLTKRSRDWPYSASSRGKLVAVSSSSTLPPQVALVSRAARGGHPRYCAELAAALANRGAEVTIIEPAEAYEAHADLHRNASVTNAAISGPDAGWFRQEIEIGRILRRRRKTVGTVVFHDTSPIRIGLITMLKTTTSWTPVTMVHNTEAHLDSAREQFKHSAALAALAVPHRVLVHNERQREELSASAFVRATTIDVVPHGTWTDAPALESGSEARPHHNLLLFGVMRSNSGLDVLLDAAPTLEREYPDITIKVVGASSSTDVAHQLKSLGRFSFIDVRDEFVSDDEAAELFAWAGFVLLPYTDYSSESGVLMQAIAHSVPVISSAGTSVADRVCELAMGPSPTGSFLEQIRAALTASDDEYAAWQSNLAAAQESFQWDDHARILLND